MDGKNVRLNVPASRKNLLVAESEINRQILGGELVNLAGECRVLLRRIEHPGALVSIGRSLAEGLKQAGQIGGNKTQEPSRFSRFLGAARNASELWRNIRGHPKS